MKPAINSCQPFILAGSPNFVQHSGLMTTRRIAEEKFLRIDVTLNKVHTFLNAIMTTGEGHIVSSEEIELVENLEEELNDARDALWQSPKE